eukprot:1161210-Pelagomonas_calceolata.AAC.10
MGHPTNSSQLGNTSCGGNLEGARILDRGKEQRFKTRRYHTHISRLPSLHGLPSSCKPTGMPLGSQPTGTEMAGRPMKLACTQQAQLCGGSRKEGQINEGRGLNEQ